MTASELKPGNPANLSLALVLVALFLSVIPSESQIPPIETGACSRTFLNFNAADQYLSVSNSPLNGTAGTFEGWIQRDDWSAHADNIIFSNGIAYHTNHSLYLSLHPVGLHFRYGSISPGQGTAAYHIVTTTLTDGTWHHVAASWSHVSGTTTITVFLDGDVIATSSVPYLIDPGANLFFGRNNEAQNFGNGAMAEFRLWNFAKNSAQIIEDMNSTLTGNETGLVGYWPMNESGGTVAANLVAGGSDATFVHPTVQLEWQQMYPFTLSADGETYLPGTDYDFGMEGLGQSSDHVAFTIKNVSATGINLPHDPLIALTGADADQFTIDLTTTSDVLAPGASSNFEIAFTPTSLGTKSAAVSIVTVDGCEDFFTLNLTGSATPTLSYSGPGFTETSANNGEVEGYITVAVNGDTFLDDGDDLLTIGSDVILENIPAGLTPVLTLNSPAEATLTLTGNADNHQRTDNESSIAFDFNETAFSNGSAIAPSASSLGIAFTNNPIITFSGDGFTETSDNTGAVEGSIVIALSGDNFLDDGGLLELGTQVTVNNVPDGLTPVMNVVVNAPPASIWQVDQPDGNAWRSVAYGDGKFVAVSYQGDVLVMTASETNTTYDLIDLPSNTWTSVTYGNGLFVAVSYDGMVMTSADGIEWTSHTATASSGWRSVTYGNGLFVAVASTGTNRVMTSEDGITWTPSSAAEANYWTSVIYGEGVFVAVATDGDNRVMTSPDGINWTSREASEASLWQDVTYGDGKFVAVSYDGTNRVMTSDDGISWVAQSTPIGNYTAVAYGGGTFVAVAASGSSSAIISADGENWTAVETNTFDWQGLAYGDEYFVAVGEGPITGHVMTSSVIARAFAMLSLTGNASGHQVTDNVNSVSFEFTDLAFAENIATDVLNATGASASGPGVSFNDNPAIAYSGAGFQETNANDGSVTGSVIIELTGDSFQDDDEDGLLDVGTEVMINHIPDGLTPVFSITDNTTPGENWTTTSAIGNSWYSVAYGNGLFVATGENGYFITSPDGITWTSRTVAEANVWKSVAFGDGMFVAVSYNGAHRIMTSPDGINWTARMAPEANAWYAVTHGNGQFVAVASTGTNRVMTSDDGINWTARATPVNDLWTSVTYGNGQFVAISSSNKFMTSPDGITWTARVVPFGSWFSVTYGEGLFVATANNSTNSIITSPDGITWTVRTAPEQNAWFSVTYGNGLFVAAAASGSNRIMTSPDGITWTPRSATTANDWQSITHGAGKFVAVGSSNPSVITSSSFSSAEAEITFTGKATSHAPANDVAAITVEFTDAAFGSSPAAQVLNATGPANTGKGIKFADTQTLTFDELPIKTYGEEPFEISATSSSGLPVSYTSSNENVATIEGNIVTIVGAGSATITAMQEGNEDFIAAEPVDQVLTVNKANQTINFSSLAERAFEEEGDFELTATATSALGITYSSSNEDIAEIFGSTVFLMGTGTVTITASQAGNESYFAAEDVTQELIIHKGDQTITFGALPEKTFGDEDFELQGTVFSDARIVTYTSSDENVATISGNIVTIVGVGSTIITASQSGNDDFNPADDVEQVLVVNKADQTITFHELQAKAFGDADFNLTAESGSGNTIVFTSSDESVATISGNVVTIVGIGTTTITASQSGDDNYNAAENVEQILTVNKADQTIAFSTLSARTFGDADFSLTAEGGASGNEIVFTSSDESVATISGSTVTIVGAGTTTITASQPGNDNYNAAENVEQTLTVNKAGQAIAFSPLSARTFGDAEFSLTAEGGASGNAIVFTSSDESVATVSGSTVTIVGAGTTNITASQPGNDNYNAAEDVSTMLTIEKASQQITFNSIGTKVFGDLPFDLGATATSGLPVSYESSNSAIVSIAGNAATVVGAGSVTLTATQSGNSNYHAAQEISQTFCVNPSQPSITSDFLNPGAPVLISSHLVGNQWYLNGDVIPGAVNQSYTVTQAGDYTVQTMTDNCVSDFAESFTLLITGLDMEAATITLYPNPAKDKLVVKGITAETQVSIVSGTGVDQNVFSEWNKYENERTMFIENLSGGVYILTLKGKAGTRQIKFSKN